MITVTATMQTPGVSVDHFHKNRRDPRSYFPYNTSDSQDIGVAASTSASSSESPTSSSSTLSNPNLRPVTAPVPSAGGVSSDSRLTNEFNFVFHCDKPEMIPRVFPRTYDDAMQWISAHRRLTLGSKLAEERRAKGGAVGRFNDL